MTPAVADAMGVTRLVRSAASRLALARLAGIGLAMVVIGSLVLPPVIAALGAEGFGDVIGFAGMVAAVLWVVLGVSAARLGRRVREASALASVGRADLAEGRALETLTSFCLLRPVTLGAAAVMARVRQSQGRHAEAAGLASFVLGRRERALTGEKRGLRLLLAESLVELGEAEGARLALMPLYAPASSGKDRLTLPEALRLLGLQLRVQALLNDWQAMHARVASTLPMAELMPPAEMARSTALLLRAAAEAGDEAWRTFLAQRVQLLADPEALQKAEPTLSGRLDGLLRGPA